MWRSVSCATIFMEIINAHVHVYPDAIATKAAMSIGQFYNAPVRHNGTIEELLKENKENGVSKCLIHSVATTTHQVQAINKYIKSLMDSHNEFIGFMALHPDMEKQQIEDEVQKAIEQGFKGVKLHPDCQKFYIDEQRAQKIYEVVEGRLPILMHMGDTRYDYSSISRLLNVLNHYEGLQIIAAHMGGYSHWGEVGLYHTAKYNNFHFDTTSSLSFLSPELATTIIKDFGVEKYFFGSDYPMWRTDEELALFYKLDLSKDEQEAILGKNLKDFLNIQ